MAIKVVTTIPELIMEDLKLKGFKVYELTESAEVPVSTGRRDFYKMGLITGNMKGYYGGKPLEIKNTVLFFINPNIPHSITHRSGKTTGYGCLFTEAFITGWE